MMNKEVLPVRNEVLPVRNEVLPVHNEVLPVHNEVLRVQGGAVVVRDPHGVGEVPWGVLAAGGGEGWRVAPAWGTSDLGGAIRLLPKGAERARVMPSRRSGPCRFMAHVAPGQGSSSSTPNFLGRGEAISKGEGGLLQRR